MKKVNDFARHVILYSKGWYGKSEGKAHVLTDLGLLLQEYAALPGPGSVGDIYDFIVRTFTEYLPRRDQYEALSRLWFSKSADATIGLDEIATAMVGMISTLLVAGELDMDMTLLPIRFGEKVGELKA